MVTTARWQAQRWLVDAVVGTVGVDWDQGRTHYLQAPCGPDAAADFQGIRTRVRRFDDISREFERAAVRRERLAKEAEAAGHAVSARDHRYIASILYGGAQWPIFENDRRNLDLDTRKTECYTAYAERADHRVERVEIPSGASSLPGWLHLPPGHRGGALPTVLAVDGMDGFKEMLVSLYGDKLLARGLAVLALDGPGQGECTTRDIHATADSWLDAGRAIFPWMRARPEIDGERIAVSGVSFGSFWATQLAATDERLAGCAVALACHEPGCHTIFETASPTFKLRFMYMTGHDDEAEFDAFARTLSLRGIAGRVACPYLCVAGERDELSPIEHTYALFDELRVRKELMVFQGERHGLSSTTATFLGPDWNGHIADWLADRLAGAPAPSRRLFVDVAGTVHASDW
jgi:dipeptidyl aminopeptidase/acylaminoacyl peptidase